MATTIVIEGEKVIRRETKDIDITDRFGRVLRTTFDAMPKPILIRNVADLTYGDSDTVEMIIGKVGEEIYVFMRLYSWTFHGDFGVDVENEIPYVYMKPGSRVATKATWGQFGANKLFIAMNEAGNKAWFGFFDTNKRQYHLPMPNLHEDGQICLGNEFRVSGDTLQAKAQHLLTFLHSSRFNGDLFSEEARDKTRDVFRWDMNMRQVLFAEGMTVDYLREKSTLISSNIFDPIGDLI